MYWAQNCNLVLLDGINAVVSNIYLNSRGVAPCKLQSLNTGHFAVIDSAGTTQFSKP